MWVNDVKKLLKKILKNAFFTKLFNLLHIKYNGKKGNQVKINSLIRCKGKFFFSEKSENNDVFVNDDCTVKNLTLRVFGNHNVIIIEKGCYIEDLTVWIEDDNNTVIIGKNSKLCGNLKLSCMEGTKITIGEDCLFSSEIDVRTGDGHAMLDENGARINPSKDVKIDEHVWVGYRAMNLKGSHIHKNSVVGANSTVTGDAGESAVAVAGTPAKIIKRNINWHFDRDFVKKKGKSFEKIAGDIM